MSISALEQWYLSQCNGEWEHAWGIRIETLDNPGWIVTIDLQETKKEGKSIARGKLDRGKNDWIQYWVENSQFQIRCGPLNLSEAIEIFIGWFDLE